MHVLDANHLHAKVVDVSLGDQIPSPTNYRAIFVLGGPTSANDKTASMTQELERTSEALANNIPYFGICLGMQVLVKAAGGKVFQNPFREIGFVDGEGKPYTMTATEQGRKDPLLAGVPATHRIFHLHGETVETPESVELLAAGNLVKNQLVKVKGKIAYGIQGHLELDPLTLERWLREDDWLKELNPKEVSRQYYEIQKEFNQVAFTLFNNFVNMLL